jgi:hypothetical protein
MNTMASQSTQLPKMALYVPDDYKPEGHVKYFTRGSGKTMRRMRCIVLCMLLEAQKCPVENLLTSNVG